jgi:hypothetical protein
MDGDTLSGGNRPDVRRRLRREVGRDPPVSEGEREGGGGPRLGWKRREEAGPKLLLGLKSKRVKRKINFN